MKGGHGGHNGLRSIMQHFGGSQDFPRIKIGERHGITPAAAL
jgi:PTH1 family peptidyl-tRNA hydrolase